MMQLARSRAGFTLIEIMVALVITAIVLAMVYSSFNAVMETRERVTASTNGNMTARLVLSRLSREIESAYIVKRAESAPPESRYTLFEGSEDSVGGLPASRLSFTTFAHTKRGVDANESDQSLISYECAMLPADDGTHDQLALIRREWRRVAPPGETQTFEPVAVPLAEGIEGFQLRFLEPERGEWTEEWDSRNVRSLDALPAAVEIKLSLKDGHGKVLDYMTVASPMIAPISRETEAQEGETVVDDESEPEEPDQPAGEPAVPSLGTKGTNVQPPE
jgi:prepilin-type N-terminal cleavage/methylation domain-containing protein